MPKLARSPEELRAISAAAQRDSWRRHPQYRRRRLALGQIRGLLHEQPDALEEVIDVAHQAAAEGVER